MFRKPVLAAVLAAAALAAPALLDAAAPILPVSQVKAGMKGVGRSVFLGGRVEEFEAEILGVLANIQPKRSLILARLRGRGLESTGVIAGMSGSPVYVDGKMIGAVSSGFSYAKDAIAGITPIEEMLEVRERATPRTAASLPYEFLPSRSLSLEELGHAFRAAAPPVEPVQAGGGTLTPLPMPVVLNGFSAGGFERARGFLAGLGLQAVRGGAAAGQAVPPAGPVPTALPTLAEGDAVAMQLVSGDLDMSAVGTVTYVDGDRVLAFGHPFYNLGPVDYGMARADVITVVPSLESSFKVAATGPVIGRFTQDRTAGALGVLGPPPKLVPVNVTLETAPGRSREFHVGIVNDRILSPALANLVLYSLVTGEERVYGDVSLDFDGEVFLESGASIRLEDLFSGNYNNATTDLSGLVAAVLYLLKNNEFEDVPVYRVDLRVRAVEEPRACVLDRVILDRYEAAPGERIRAQIAFRTRGGGLKTEEVEVPAPDLPPGSEFQLLVGDAAAMSSVERSQYRSPELAPRSLPQLVRLLGNLRKNNRIYVKVQASRPGLFSLQDPLTQRLHESGLFGDADELVRIQQSRQGMAPSDQCFHSTEP